MKTNLESTIAALYETDFVRWVETNLEHLRAGDYAHVDWANLLEEIEDMSRSERRSLRNNLSIILLYLLKWQYQPEMRSGSWKGSLVEHRQRIQDILESSPSLKLYLQQCFDRAYQNAVERAAAETGLPPFTFPEECPYKIEQVLDSTFLPE